MIAPLFVLFACAAPEPAPKLPQTPAAMQDRALTSEVRTAALFKNGFAFVRRAAEVKAGTASAVLEALPVPVHGTFWIAGDAERSGFESAVARRAEVRELVQARTIEEILRANVGRKLTLTLGEAGSLNGVLTALSGLPLASVQGASPSSYLVPPGPPSTLVYFESSQQNIVLRSSEVTRVSAAGEALGREYERAREAVSLELAFAAGAGGQPGSLSISYLVRGLTWVPSYAIDVMDPSAARLTAKAVVINEAEDLDGATLQFVTGFPNLGFAHVMDPIALRGGLDAFFAALGRSGGADVPLVMQQAVLSNAFREASESASFPATGPPDGGTALEDLFFYEQPNVRLKRGERGLYPLFSVRVPYEHLYEWTIGDTVEGQASSASDQEEIWHSVRLTNDSGLPWTTAPAMTMKGENLLGQDTLHYAADGGQTTVRITRAVDVQGARSEFETARDRDAAEFHGRRYDRVTVKGELRATNHKRSAVQLEITKTLQGEISSNPNGAEVATVAEGLRKLNPTKRLTWSVLLEPGKTAEIEYEYTLYVRP